jgi:type VI secretion system secreted protein VgrG
VQYRETDFNFVSRLMESEGIGYYFRHTDGHDTLVLTDSASKHTAPASCAKLSFVGPEEQVKPELEHISAWDCSREIQPGVYVHDDYDLERPSVELKTSKVLPRKYKPSDYEVYDYPGEYLERADGEQYASVRIDELGSQFELAHAITNARGLACGSLLTLEDHPRADQNREYLVVGASHELTFGDYESLPETETTSYRCAFAAMPSSQQFRPKRETPKPFVQGPQTAVVVGPGGEEIFTDKYGRVKVQFHWDRRGKKDDKSSCWIRVSHPWAGKGWGAISTPRIGQEVIVDFLEGDPDQPIITGRVYNAEQMPPYDLPANKTQSGMKSRSSMGGGAANFNEIRMEDKTGSEQLFIHAEKNQDIEVENDETHWVGHDRKKTIDHDEMVLVKHDRSEVVDNDESIVVHHDRKRQVDHDETIIIGNDRTLTVRRDKYEHVDRNKSIEVLGTHSESISSAMMITVGGTLTETVAINYAETVGAAMELTVGGALAITVGAVMAETVGGAKVESIGAAKSENVGGGRSLHVGGGASETIGKDRAINVTKDEKKTIGGQSKTSVTKEYILNAKKIQLVGEDEIHLKCGPAEILMKKNGDITVKGNKISVKGSGDVVIKGSKIAEN